MSTGRGLPAARQRSAASFRLGFQPVKVSVKLVFGNAFAALEFFDAPANLRVNRVAVGREPFIPLVQHLKGPVYYLLWALVRTGAQGLRYAVLLVGLQFNGHRACDKFIIPLSDPVGGELQNRPEFPRALRDFDAMPRCTTSSSFSF